MRNLISNFLEATLDFVYPPLCILCQELIENGQPLVCDKCWAGLSEFHLKGEPDFTTQPEGLTYTRSLWAYNDKVEKLIHEVKFFRKLKLGSRVGKDLAKLVKEDKTLSRAALIIPVPLHSTRFRERGYNQSLLLAAEIASQTKLTLQTNALKRVVQTKAQSKLKAAERKLNIRRAFRVQNTDLIKNKSILLVDDVMTTGSTLSACAVPLFEAGAREILAITAAVSLLDSPQILA